jgi:hypothetical protein
MVSNREHPLYYLDAETLLVAIYVWVDDELKALQTQGFKLPPKQRHQKATLAELLTLAIFLLLQGQDLAKGYLAAKSTLKAYFPSLPHLSRFYRVLQKAQGILAHLAIRLAGGWVSSRWWTSNPFPWPTATASMASPSLRLRWG